MNEVSVNNIFVFTKPGTVKGKATVTINGIKISGIKIIEGRNGLFAGLPSEKGKDDKYYPLVNIESKELYQELQDRVMEAYTAKLNGEEYRESDLPF